ncbi:hypothetical protein CPC08DRAFT_706439 [Agrocybe pediades]|nr:hypothetical protein CPC08DRAFT_706439 [Agrocybe pediades]
MSQRSASSDSTLGRDLPSIKHHYSSCCYTCMGKRRPGGDRRRKGNRDSDPGQSIIVQFKNTPTHLTYTKAGCNSMISVAVDLVGLPSVTIILAISHHLSCVSTCLVLTPGWLGGSVVVGVPCLQRVLVDDYLDTGQRIWPDGHRRCMVYEENELEKACLGL